MIIAGYILAIHKHIQEEQDRVTPGNTPIRRRNNQSQTQKTQGDLTTTPSLVGYSQGLVDEELSQRLFAWVDGDVIWWRSC